MPNINRRTTSTTQEEQTTDPGKLIDIKIKQLRNDFKGRAHRLKTSGIAVDAHNRILAGWQTEYDRAKGSLADDKSKLELASRMVRTGEMLPETARDVGRHTMGLPSAPRAVAERQPSAVGMSPGVQTSYFKMFSSKAARKGLITDPKGFIRKKHRKFIDPKKMKEMYFRQREITNLDDPYNVAKMAGFNHAFGNAMAQDEDTRVVFEELLEEDPQMKAAFAPSTELNRAFLGKFKSTKSVSPLGRSIASGLPKQPQQAPEPIRQWSESRGQTRVSYDGGRTWQIE